MRTTLRQLWQTNRLVRNAKCVVGRCYSVHHGGNVSSMYWRQGEYVIGRTYTCHRHLTQRRHRWSKPVLRSVLG